MERATGERPSLVVGAVGAFEVFDGERLVFSKLRDGRFPEDAEILAALGR